MLFTRFPVISKLAVGEMEVLLSLEIKVKRGSYLDKYV